MPGIFEIVGSRGHTVSLSPDENVRPLHYRIYGTDDDTVARQLVETTIPAFYDGQRFNRYQLTHEGNGLWMVEVTYGRKKPTSFLKFDFDTAGEKTKLTQSLHSDYYPALDASGQPQETIDFKNAINVQRSAGKTKVEGVDVGVPAFGFTVSQTFGPETPMDSDFIGLLDTCSWHINNDVIDVTITGIELHAEPGELLFQGATGSQKSGGNIVLAEIGPELEGEVALKFAKSPNITLNMPIELDPTKPGLVVKRGWDFLWVAYEEDDSGDVIVPTIRQVNVDVVFPSAALSALFFGGNP